MSKQNLLKYGSVSINPNLITHSYYSTQVFVVGCGGTGGRLIPGLVQHIANHNNVIETVPNNKQFLKHKIALTLVDGDIVETKNLLRQNFYSFDVGKNKSEVMARRYGALHGLDVKFIPEYLGPKAGQMQKFGETNMIIFDCTDNVKARKEIEEQATASRVVIISCGNEDTFGQVLLSVKNSWNKTVTRRDYIANILNLNKAITEPNMAYKGQFTILPTLLEIFTDFKDTVAPSCTDIRLQDDQSMPINALVAQLAYNVFYNLVAGSKFNYHMVKCSTNNIFDTKFVNHPIALLDLYYKAFLGDSSQEAQACFTDFVNIGFRGNSSNNYYLHSINFVDVKALIEKHGKYSKPFVNMYLEGNYYLSSDSSAYLNNVLASWEKKVADL